MIITVIWKRAYSTGSTDRRRPRIHFKLQVFTVTSAVKSAMTRAKRLVKPPKATLSRTTIRPQGYSSAKGARHYRRYCSYAKSRLEEPMQCRMRGEVNLASRTSSVKRRGEATLASIIPGQG